MHQAEYPQNRKVRRPKLRKITALLLFISTSLLLLNFPIPAFSMPLTTVSPELLAFVSDRDSASSYGSDIYVMNSSGGDINRLTNKNASNPDWSPDGSRIAFQSTRDSTDGYSTSVYVMNADGSGVQRLITGTGSDPDWSPDGTKITFTAGDIGNIYVMNADGSNIRQLTTNGGSEPDWSPDGTRIAFHALGGDFVPIPLTYIMNADGTNIQQVGFGSDPAWSPDGTKIAYSSCCGSDPASGIYVMNADGSNNMQLTDEALYGHDPSWSPDGSRIAFSQTDSSGSNHDIYTMNADGSGQTRITNNSSTDWQPVWRPSTTPKNWTLMFYLDGDNNLDRGYTTPVFNELELAANNLNVNIVALWDRSTEGDSAYFIIKHDQDLTHTASYTLNVDRFPVSGNNEATMGDPQTLIDFITWTRNKFSTQYYALILSDHGTGLGGSMIDETGEGDLITAMELRSALVTATNNGANKIDVLYMDACLMGMIEVAYQVRGLADYYIASENIKWGLPEPHFATIHSISSTTTPIQLADSFAQAYQTTCGNWNLGCTMSVADMSRLDNLVSATNNLAQLLNDQLLNDPSGITAARITTIRSAVQRFEMNRDNDPDEDDLIDLDDQYIDLYDFARLVQVNFTEETVRVAAQGVMDAVKEYIPENRLGRRTGGNGHGREWLLNNSHGVSIFFPNTASSFYSAQNYDFAVGATWQPHPNPGPSPEASLNGTTSTITWGTMLVSYFQTTQPNSIDDPTPPQPLSMPLPPHKIIYLPIIRR